MYYVDCGSLYDGTGSELLREARIVVEDGRVNEVGPAEDVAEPDGAARIDHSDETVLPGLIDAHLHLWGMRSMEPFVSVTESNRPALKAARASMDCRALLDAGFTTVRDVGSDVALGLRDAIAEGEIPGPRIYTSGRAFSQTAGHGDRHYLPKRWLDTDDDPSVVDGPTECRKGARRRIRQGADLIKLSTTGGVLSEKDEPHQSQFTDDEISAFTEEAHRVDMPVAAHAQGASGIKNALRNGVDTIEHGIYLDEEAVSLLKETDAVLVPTLSIVDRICEHGADHGLPDWGLEKAARVRDAHLESIRWAYEEGISIAAGTDFLGPDLVPHGENAMELEIFVEDVGMDPEDALYAATGGAAATVPDDDVGTLSAGDRADFVAVNGDPLADVSLLRSSIDAVYLGGELADP
ncbi:metal-dependent hydrolase family protein [Halovivax gelatinilyticus]|uniref:metal-dependent hydrolase family protein n=1 Tax=Halovivax gelatinilyticus TaxID=2961597 RepID=UPI0020CA4233|nr:amidohydrolase family protein [Halovivax gelatinilyticus]